LDIWFGSDEKCVFGAVIGRELGSRGQDLLVGSQTISRLLSTQYGIYIWSYSCCFGCLVCSGRAPSLGGTSVAGSRAHARDLREGG
jgi:hypothetical protein